MAVDFNDRSQSESDVAYNMDNNKDTKESVNFTEHPSSDAFLTRRDSDLLAQIGKKQVLKRRFGFISMLSLTCTCLLTWEGILQLFSIGFLNGGTVGLLGQFILTWFGTLSVFVCIGELASMAPTAGGQYHWVAMLSPRSTRNFLSYLTGWMTCLAWVISVAAVAFYVATLIAAICYVTVPSYATIEQPYQVTLMTWAVVVVAVLFNTVIGEFLAATESAFLVLHILGFFAVLIPLVVCAPEKKSATEVFSGPFAYQNAGGWPTYGVSFMVGTVGSAVALLGADAAAHLAEEIHNPSVNVPKSICVGIVINGALGLAMLLAALFCMGDPTAALEAQQEYGYPFIEIFISATNSVAGSAAMTSIVIVLNFSTCIGIVATASRMIWSFARDKGLPFSSVFSRVSAGTKLPVMGVALAAVIPCLLVLINLGSSVVFNVVTSLAMVGFYSTYLVSCGLLLYRRIKGQIATADPNTRPVPAHLSQSTDEYVLMWGPFHVPGVLGTVNNAVALAYLATLWVFGFFPGQTPVDASTMNYACAVFGFAILYGIGYYILWGRHQYKGPIVEVSH